MCALQTRNTVMALMEETTEGTPVVPAAGTDFIALQDGFSLEPSFAILDNKELKASIGKTKSILGAQSPKASLSHYLRHSGVEGQAPNYRKLLKALFGSEVVASTQSATTTGSTVSQVKVTTGAGANFQRGQCMLLKDGTNGYSIRPVHSVSGDNLTPGFNLLAGPASGVQLGKSVMYAPVNTGHPTLSMWGYRANGGAVELISGCRVTQADLTFKAGDLISGAYSLEGVQFFFNPILVGATNYALDFVDGVTTYAASVPQAMYQDPIDLAAAIQAAMNSVGASSTFTVSYDNVTGKFMIASSGSTFTLKLNTGANAANGIGSTLGFSVAADATGALTYTGANALSFKSPVNPSYDNADPLAAKANEVLIGDATSTTPIKASSVSCKIVDARKTIDDVSSVSGISGSVITERQVEIQVSALLSQNDVDKWKRFRAGDDTRFLYNAGVKSGGNWVPGKCVSLYLPSATVTSWKINDNGGLVTLDFTVAAYVDSQGNGEVYLNFV